MASDSFFREWRRLAAASTVTGALAGEVADLAPVTTVRLPEWMQRLPLPTGWRVVPSENGPPQPTRTAVHGPDSGGQMDGCETVSVFRFEGRPPDSDVLALAGQTLRELGADSITTRRLIFPEPQAVAVRSSGFLNLPGRRSWLQYTGYLLNPQPPAPGVLVEQNILTISADKDRLHHSITELSNTIRDAVAGITKTVRQAEISGIDQAERPPAATLRVQPYEDINFPLILVNANEGGLRLLRSAVRSAHTDGTNMVTKCPSDKIIDQRRRCHSNNDELSVPRCAGSR